MTILKAKGSKDHQKFLESSRDCPPAFSQLDFSRKQRLNRMKSITATSVKPLFQTGDIRSKVVRLCKSAD